MTGEDLFDSPLGLVLPGKPEESGLVIALKGKNPNKTMPPLKKADGTSTELSRLTDLELKAIISWIQNGSRD